SRVVTSIPTVTSLPAVIATLLTKPKLIMSRLNPGNFTCFSTSRTRSSVSADLLDPSMVCFRFRDSAVGFDRDLRTSLRNGQRRGLACPQQRFQGGPRKHFIHPALGLAEDRT